MQFQIIK